MNGLLLIAYKVMFVSLESKGLTNFIGSVTFLGFGFWGIFSFGWFGFEGEMVFPDGDGGIPGVTLLPIPLKVKPTLYSSLGQVLW